MFTSSDDRYHFYAGLAMQALIAKIPLHDQEGSLGKNISQQDMKQLRIEVAASAFAFAEAMVEVDYALKKAKRQG